MKHVLAAVAALCLALAFMPAHAQTAPSVSTTIPVAFAAGTPAIAVTVTNASMAATQTNTNGIETGGPGTTELWYCVGSASSPQCAAGMLPPQSSDTPPQNSGWILAGSVAQNTSSVTAAILNVSFGNLYQIAARSQWTAGGGFGAFPSTFLAATIPAAPAAQPPATNTSVVAVIL